MTPEQKELDRKFQGALTVFHIHLEWLRKTSQEVPGGKPTAEMLVENAIENVLDVYNDWRKHLSEPVKLTPSALARELRLLADKIERERLIC